jgi:hypothetical protein
MKMAEEKRPTVMVGCRIPGGVRLHLMERREKPLSALADAGSPHLAMFKDLGWLDLPGFRSAQASAPGTPSRSESLTEVDKESFDLWMAENKESPLVTSGSIYVDEPKAEDPAQSSERSDEDAGAEERDREEAKRREDAELEAMMKREEEERAMKGGDHP